MKTFREWLNKAGHCLPCRAREQAPPLSPGAEAEALAARFLEDKGLRILARNFRCKGGEIDLIAEDAGTLVFVEVRLRRNARFGGAAASITPLKQGRILRAASLWLKKTGAPRPCRFDALLLEELSEASVEWRRDAFRAPTR